MFHPGRTEYGFGLENIEGIPETDKISTKGLVPSKQKTRVYCSLYLPLLAYTL